MDIERNKKSQSKRSRLPSNLASSQSCAVIGNIRGIPSAHPPLPDSASAIINNLKVTRDASNARKLKNTDNEAAAIRRYSKPRAISNNSHLLEHSAKISAMNMSIKSGSFSPLGKHDRARDTSSFHLTKMNTMPFMSSNIEMQDNNIQTASINMDAFSNTQRLEYNQRDFNNGGETSHRIRIIARFRPQNLAERNMKEMPSNLFINQVAFNKHDPSVVDIVDGG